MMTSILISALFASGAAFAVITIAATLRANWPAVLALREAANYQPETNELRITDVIVEVKRAAAVLRPEFKRSRAAPGVLRAAA